MSGYSGSGSGAPAAPRHGTAGAGVLAENTAGGTALNVQGKAAFSRSSILTVTARRSSAVEAGIALTPVSLVLATNQGNVAGSTSRARA